MNDRDRRFTVDFSPVWKDTYPLYVVDWIADGQGKLLTGNGWMELEEGSIYPSPTLMLSTEDAQRLFNELWRIGCRPQDTKELGMAAHLADMRRLVFEGRGDD